MVDAQLPQSSCAYEEMELQFAGKALASSGVSLDVCFSSNKWLTASVRVNNLHKFNYLDIFESNKLTWIYIILVCAHNFFFLKNYESWLPCLVMVAEREISPHSFPLLVN